MKAVIDEYGILSLEKRGIMEDQGCPHQQDGTRCGVWCPLFNFANESESGIDIQLCKTTLFISDFTDERPRKEGKQ